MSIPSNKHAGCDRAIEKIKFILRIEPLTVGVDQIEPLLDDLLEFIVAHQECTDLLAPEFIGLLDTLPPSAEEIVQYCMHELRWPVIREHVERCLGRERDITRHRVYERILEAFDDDWNEREFYARYDRTSGDT